MAFAKTWIVELVHSRLVKRGKLDEHFFRKEALPYSSVWIDANSGWQECGVKMPTELCGRQSVSIYIFIHDNTMSLCAF
jgi:hypothetical protein